MNSSYITVILTRHMSLVNQNVIKTKICKKNTLRKRITISFHYSSDGESSAAKEHVVNCLFFLRWLSLLWAGILSWIYFTYMCFWKESANQKGGVKTGCYLFSWYWSHYCTWNGHWHNVTCNTIIIITN